jgi:hypothetical protein
MKNNAYFSFQRPKDFITIFGKDVMQLFPHVMPKTATSVNCKPKIVIQRVNQSQADFSRFSLRDIFYKVDSNIGEELRLRTSPNRQIKKMR